MKTPLLSVCLITYNHKNYIIEAIEGMLMQEVTFSWELIIADDYSTDGTREILLEYKEKHPEFIKLILQEKNVGAAKNWMDLIITPKSKYIAYFEGDDYWTDKSKLQKQVDFLEKNNNYSIVHSNFYIKNENQQEIKNSNIKSPLTTDTNFLIQVFNIRTCTVLFRNNSELFNKFPLYLPYGDYPLFLRASLFGKIKLLQDYTAVYRINESSISHSDHLKIPELNRIKILEWFKKENPKFKNVVYYSKAYLIQKMLNRYRTIKTFKNLLSKYVLSYFVLYLQTLFLKNKYVKLRPISLFKSIAIIQFRQ